MWTTDKIERFCKEYGFVPNQTTSELSSLHKILYPDEVLMGLLDGILKEVFGKNYNGNGMVIATNKRVIFYRKNFLGITTKEEISLQKVSSASIRKGLIFSSIILTSSNNEAIVKQCENKSAEKFITVLTNLIHNSHTLKTTTGGDDLTQKLEKLFELKQRGILTKLEFNDQKAKILAS
jgi:hypothetical protein